MLFIKFILTVFDCLTLRNLKLNHEKKKKDNAAKKMKSLFCDVALCLLAVK